MAIIYNIWIKAAHDPVGRIALGLYLHDRNQILRAMSTSRAKARQAIINDFDLAMGAASAVAAYRNRAIRKFSLDLVTDTSSSVHFNSSLLIKIDWTQQLKLAVFSFLVGRFLMMIFEYAASLLQQFWI